MFVLQVWYINLSHQHMIEITMLPAPFTDFPAQTLIHLRKGQCAFQQDDPTTGLFYVARGSVALLRHSEAGHQIVIHRALQGETLAEASLFSTHYHCDCVALQDSDLVRLDKTVMLKLLQQDAEFAFALLRRFAGQVQGYRRRLEILAIKGAADRVFAALADFGQQGNVTDFAAAIGLSHEATFRALSALVKRGEVQRVARGRYRVGKHQGTDAPPRPL